MMSRPAPAILVPFLWLLLSFPMAGQTVDARVELPSRNLTIGQFFSAVESQTGFLLVYSGSDFSLGEGISFARRKGRLKQLLDAFIAEKNLQYEVSNNYIVISKATGKAGPGKENPDRVTGRIVDPGGLPVIGASVFLKRDGSVGTVSDADGRFRLPTRDRDILVVSCLGFKTLEVAVSAIGDNQVVMQEDRASLDEVVVVGYGSTRKAHLTGAVDAVTAEVFEHRPIANMQQMLRGFIPNLSAIFSDGKPSRATTFQIRGVGSLGSSTGEGSTLVLIDGVEGDPELLNPDDIESVSVLKDAASAAIYGSRGPYGVILITTKCPQMNAEKVTVRFSSGMAFSYPSCLPDNVTDGLAFTELAMMSRYGWSENYRQTQLTSTQMLYGPAGGKVNLDVYRDNFVKWRREGHEGVIDVASNGYYIYYGSTDWTRLLYKDTAFSHIQNVSVSGSTGKISYLVSGRLYDYGGLYEYDPDNYRTMNLRSKVSVQMFPWLKLTENISYTYDYLHQPVTMETDMDSFEGTISFSAPESQIGSAGVPTMVPFNPDGSLTRSAAYVFGSMIGRKSFVDIYKKSFVSTTGLEAVFFDNTLRLHGDFTFRDYRQDRKAKKTGVEYSSRQGETENLLNATQLHNRYLSDVLTFTDYKAANGWLEYENTFGTKHYFKAMGGFNYEVHNRMQFLFAKHGLEYEDADSYEFALGEWDGSVYQNRTNNFKTGLVRWRQAGFFYRLNYAFADRYLLELDGRYDGSSKFLYTRQWGFFPSGSVGWRISRERWWQVDPTFVSELKLRASYGELGDAASLDAYAFDEYYTPNSYRNARVIDGNPNASYMEFPTEVYSGLTWATVRTKDIGVDAAFLNGKLSLTADGFIRQSLGMIVDDNRYPVVSGTTSAKTNSADMSTYGWELVTTWNDSFRVAGKPLHIGLRFVYGDNWTVIDKYTNDTGSISADTFRSGQRYGEIWGFRTNGIFSSQEEIDTAFRDKDDQPTPYVNTLIKTNAGGKIMVGDLWLNDLDGDGKITIGDDTEQHPGDREILGNMSPRHSFGLGVHLDWMGFYLTAHCDGVARKDWSPAGRSGITGMYGSTSRPTLKWTVDNMWTPEHPDPDALFPRISSGNRYFYGYTYQWGEYRNQYPVDRYIFNVGYIRLSSLTLGFNLPRRLLDKVRLSDARVYIAGENVWDWSPFYRYTKDYDVLTINSPGDDLVNGINWDARYIGQQYPVLRTWSLGVSVRY